MTAGTATRADRPAARAGWRRALTRRGFNVVAVGLSVLLLIAIIYPLIAMIVRQLFPDGVLNLAAIEGVMQDGRFHVAVRNTAIIIPVSGTLAVLIGSTFAWLNERTDARMQRMSTAVPLIPLVLPPIALSIGWMFLAERTAGIVNVVIRNTVSLVGITMTRGPFDIVSWYGVIFLYTIWLVPFVYILMSGALRNLDSALEEASRISGAGVVRTLWRVSLPAVLPAIASAGFLVLLLGVAQFSIGRTIGAAAQIDIVSVYLVRLFRSFPPDVDAAVFVGLLILAVVFLAWLVQQRLTKRGGFAVISGRSQSPAMVRLGAWRWPARFAMILYLCIASVLPFIGLLVVAFQPFWTPRFDIDSMTLLNFSDFLGNPYHRGTLFNSLRLGLMGATLGMGIAALLISYARFYGGYMYRVIDGTARSPGAISNIVIAVAFLLAFGGAPTYLAGTLTILLVVYVIINMPQAWVTTQSAMNQVGQELIDASFISGATNLRTFVRVNIPLMSGGIAAGWAMVFVVMVGDLTASAILAGVNNPVVGFVILDIWDSGTFSQLAALGVMMAAISAVVIALVLRRTRRFSASVHASSGQ